MWKLIVGMQSILGPKFHNNNIFITSEKRSGGWKDNENLKE